MVCSWSSPPPLISSEAEASVSSTVGAVLRRVVAERVAVLEHGAPLATV